MVSVVNLLNSAPRNGPPGAVDRIHDLLYPWTTTEQVSLANVRLVPVPDLGRRTTWVVAPTRARHDGPWTVRHKALLDQIEDTVTGSTTAGQVFHAAYGSKPAGRLDCLAFLARVNAQSLALAREHGIRLKPLRPRLSALAGKLGLEPNRMVTRWWVSARILTQHDGPPMAPNAPCPNEECDSWGTLRVRFDPDIALCVHCGQTWDEGAFEELVTWIRWASSHLAGTTHWCYECILEREERAERSLARCRKRA